MTDCEQGCFGLLTWMSLYPKFTVAWRLLQTMYFFFFFFFFCKFLPACSPEEVSSSLKKENPLVVTPNAREVDGHELNATSPIGNANCVKTLFHIGVTVNSFSCN